MVSEAIGVTSSSDAGESLVSIAASITEPITIHCNGSPPRSLTNSAKPMVPSHPPPASAGAMIPRSPSASHRVLSMTVLPRWWTAASIDRPAEGRMRSL